MEKKEQLQSALQGRSATRGFSIVEVVLSAALFALIVTSFVGTIIYGEQSSTLAGQRSRATFLAEEGLEAVRNIRDAGFSSLPANGNYGLQISSNHQWKFLGQGTTDTTDIFTRQINITTVDANRKTITSTVSWNQSPQRKGSVALTTRLTYWQKVNVSSCSTYCASLSSPKFTTGTCRNNNNQCVHNNETQESGGNTYCTVPAKICCCHP